MAHSTDCINNFDPNCEECIAWKKYREDLKGRRNFLESYWSHTCPIENEVHNSRNRTTFSEKVKDKRSTKPIDAIFERMEKLVDKEVQRNMLSKNKETLVTFQHEIKDVENTITADNICPNCEKSFKTKKTLKAHIKNVHERKNVYSCGECGENFSRSDYLTSHMRSHRGEKPFSCDQCEKAFTLWRGFYPRV